MSIRIGHASIDENGKAYGGLAGDQSGKEVCIRTWYSRPWTYLLRYPDRSVAEKAASACEAGCNNSNIGYDQYQRNTAHTKAKAVGYNLSKIIEKCETDCSAFMTLCYLAAGVSKLEYTSNAPTTSTMANVFKEAGFKVYSDSKYLTGTGHVQRGDILLAPGHHTVMVLDNGEYVDDYAAPKPSINEPSSWAKDAWTKLQNEGFFDGTRPHDNITREEMAVVIDRVLTHFNAHKAVK